MIVAFTSLSPAGATFMDWSWQWLKGSDYTWNQGQGWIPLINDPTRKNNAHAYQKNHPLGVKAWEEFIESAENESRDNDISFYPSFQNTKDNLDEFVDQMNKLSIISKLLKTVFFVYGLRIIIIKIEYRDLFMTIQTEVFQMI